MSYEVEGGFQNVGFVCAGYFVCLIIACDICVGSDFLTMMFWKEVVMAAMICIISSLFGWY